MAAQVPLPIHDRVRQSLESAARDIRLALRAIAKKTKQGEGLARAAKMDPGNFSKALQGDTYKLDVDTLPAFFVEDDERSLIRLLCRLNRGQFVPDPEITEAERLENLKRACRMSGAAGAAILREAGEES